MLQSHCSRCFLSSDSAHPSASTLEYPLPLGSLLDPHHNPSQDSSKRGAIKSEKRTQAPTLYRNVYIPEVLSENGICIAARSLARRLVDESSFMCSLEMGCITQPVALVPSPIEAPMYYNFFY